MKHINVLVLFLTLFTSNAYAWSRMGEAEVQIRDGVVCFTVTKNEFERSDDGILRFHGYILSQFENGRSWSNVWWFAIEKSVPWKRGDCIPYGEIPKGAKLDMRANVPEKAPLLKKSVMYGLNFNVTGGSAPTISYGIKFCLKQDDAGALVVKKVRNSCDESGTEAP